MSAGVQHARQQKRWHMIDDFVREFQNKMMEKSGSLTGMKDFRYGVGETHSSVKTTQHSAQRPRCPWPI